MNKSKFLKKSLAMVLAMMMVIAMIPLGASAAEAGFTPATVTVEGSAATPGTVTGSGNQFTVEFDFTTNTHPEIVVRLNKANYNIQRILLNGTETAITENVAFAAELDEDDKPAPFRFYLVDPNGKKGDTVTVAWSVKAASKDATIKEAKLDGVKGSINAQSKEITFTMPFGYAASGAANAMTLTPNVSSATHDGGATFTGTVGTNKVKPVAQAVKVTAQDGLTDEDYKVFVVEETALTGMKIGDVKGVIEKDSDGLETGKVIFNMPADTKKDSKGKLKMVPTIEIASSYSKIELPSGTEIKNGQEFDFAALLDATTTGQVMTITKKTGGTTRDYTLVMSVDQSSTEIKSFTASVEVGGTAFISDGVVSGKNLTAEVSPKADNGLTDVDLVFQGPAGATVTLDGASATEAPAGTYTISTVNCSSAKSLKVVAADGKNQAYYTVKVTKADASTSEPKITAAKLVLGKDTANEKEINGAVSGETITFTVPYSTPATDLATGTATTVYSYGKTNLTNLVTTIDADPYKKGGTVKATSDTGDIVTYTIKFAKAAALQGKSISKVYISKADNVNLIPTEQDSFPVTASGNELKVNVPANDKSNSAYYFSYELSEGAALYSFNATTPTTGTKMTNAYDADNEGELAGGITAQTITAITNNIAYLVVDETLAVALRDDTTLTYTQIKNNYAGHYVAYNWKVTDTSRTGNRLLSLSAEDKAATGTLSYENTSNTVNLTVPYHFVDGDAFFMDYTIDPGAKLYVNGTSVPVVNGGQRDWNTTQKEVVAAAANHTSNPDFKIVKNGANLELHYLSAAGTYTKVNNLTVVPEKAGGTNRVYDTFKIKSKDAETGAALTSVKVGSWTGTISGKTATVNVPFGTNLGALPLTMTYSKYATVTVDGVAYDSKATYNFTSDVKVSVTSEDQRITNVYTIKITTGEQFIDVKKGSWYYDYVMKAYNEGIVLGVGDGVYGVGRNITRADFAVMTVRMLGVDVSTYTTAPFEDVPAGKYYTGAIAYLADKEVLGGVGEGKFEPGRSITRQEAAKVLAEALDLGQLSDTKFADDAKISGWAKDYVSQCKQAGIFNGDNNNNFNPTKPITREETAKVMVDALKVK